MHNSVQSRFSLYALWVTLFLGIAVSTQTAAYAIGEVPPSIGVIPPGEPPSIEAQKEWTFLIYLNGNNSLDRFGEKNIKQMEQVGSTRDLNVVVQWASLSRKSTQRLYVTKNAAAPAVASPVLEELGQVDMGDWKNLVEFVKWGVSKYPAKHYFLDVWDHGSGWHGFQDRGLDRNWEHRVLNPHQRGGYGIARNLLKMPFHPMDISWDDNTGHSITTLQLRDALAESAKIMGHKIDLYASDACLMAMAEIATEVADSVEIYAGSEETEPGDGWPYHTFLQKWVAKPKSTAKDVATYLTQEYIAAYSNGVFGSHEGTFSAFDLKSIHELDDAITQLGLSLLGLSSKFKSQILEASKNSQRFDFYDYADLDDFVDQLDGLNLSGFRSELTQNVRIALGKVVVAHGATANFRNAAGLSIWLPESLSTYQEYSDYYHSLNFESVTKWGDFLESVLH